VEGPVGADVVVGALDLVQVEPGIMKPLLDEADHFLVAIASPKLGHWVLEIDVFRIKAESLVMRKIFVILFECFEDVHGSGKSKGWIFCGGELSHSFSVYGKASLGCELF